MAPDALCPGEEPPGACLDVGLELGVNQVAAYLVEGLVELHEDPDECHAVMVRDEAYGKEVVPYYFVIVAGSAQ